MEGDVNFIQLKKVVDSVGSDFISQITIELLAADKSASGALINSLNYEIIEVLGNLMIRLNAESYLINVDQGRRPGKQPPSAVIRKWIDLRGIKPTNGISKDGLAFVIARSIGRKGIQPTYVIQKAKDNILKTKKDILARAAQKDVVDALNKILKTL